MIRIVIRSDWTNEYTSAFGCKYQTLDADLPELESLLTRSGWGPDGYDATMFKGAEAMNDENIRWILLRHRKPNVPDCDAPREDSWITHDTRLPKLAAALYGKFETNIVGLEVRPEESKS